MAATSDDFDFSICEGISQETTQPQSGLTEYNYFICQIKLKECYSAFDMINLDCETIEENEQYRLTLLDGEQDVSIEASSTTAYSYQIPEEHIVNICSATGWGVGLAPRTPEEQDINARGAYAINNNQCIKPASNIANNNTIFEENPEYGPILGAYSITYSADNVTPKTKTIYINDTIAPSMTASSTELYIPPEGVKYLDRMVITDNYLAGYEEINVTATLKNSANATLKSVNFINSTANIWEKEYTVPAGTASIIYSAKDTGENQGISFETTLIAFL